MSIRLSPLSIVAMNLFPFFTLIVEHYLQARVPSVVIFNCWDLKSQVIFLRNANDHLLRTQMVDMNKDFEFPGQHLNGIYNTLGIFVDFSCTKSGDIFNNASDLQLFIAKHNWLIVDEAYNYTKFREQFENAMMSIDAEITYAGLETSASNHSGATFILYDVYNNGKYLGGKLNMSLDKQVRCDSENCQTKYLSDLHLRTKYGNRCNLNDTTFRVSTVVPRFSTNASEKAILEYLSSVDNKHIDPVERFAYQCVVILQDLMNYKVRYVFQDAWSITETSGGSFGDLVDGNADLASSGFFRTKAHLKYLDYIFGITEFPTLFLFRTPQSGGLDGGVFISPFSLQVWIVFAIALVVFAILLWAVFTIECRIAEYISFIPSLLSTFLLSFGLACVQGASLIPITTGGRIAFLSLCVVTFIMYNYYTSNVLSALIGSSSKSNIKTLDQLANSRLDVGIDPRPYLNFTKDPDVVKTVQKKSRGRVSLESAFWQNADEGMLKVKGGGYAYLSDATSVYTTAEKYFEADEICDLNEILFRPTEGFLYMALVKNSTYKELVRLNLIRMAETGVTSKHRRYWMRTKLNCFSHSSLISIGLEFTGPLFVFLGIAYIFALMTLVLEIIYHKYSGGCLAINITKQF